MYQGCIALFVAMVLGAGSAGAKEPAKPVRYQGAETILRVLTTAVPSLKPVSRQSSQQPFYPLTKRQRAALDVAVKQVRSLRSDVQSYQKVSSQLPPAEAATRWLSLTDRVLQYKGPPEFPYFGDSGRPSPDDVMRSVEFSELLAVLPAPDSWTPLTDAILARPVRSDLSGSSLSNEAVRDVLRARLLRLLAYTLQANESGQWNEVDAMQKLLALDAKQKAKSDGMDRQTRASEYFSISSLVEVLSKQTTDPALIERAIEIEISIWETGRRDRTFSVPDVATLLGQDRATALITRLLLMPKASISWPTEGPTIHMARQIAREQIQKLPRNPNLWSLTYSIDADAIALYQALNRHFGKQKSEGEMGELGESRKYYLLALIISGKTREAVAFARLMKLDLVYGSMSYENVIQAGYGPQVYAFLREVARQNPRQPLNKEMIDLAPQLGKAEEVLALVRARVNSSRLTPPEREMERQQLTDLLLASDHVEEGITSLRGMLRERAAMRIPGADQGAMLLCHKMIQLGNVLHRPALITEGLETARILVTRPENPQEASLPRMGQEENLYAGLLSEYGHNAEAESFLLKKIQYSAARIKAAKPSKDNPSQGLQEMVSIPPLLTALLHVYHKAGRSADILALLDRAPQWGVVDVRPFIDDRGTNIGYITANALVKKGRSTEAVSILMALLERNGGYDPAYALLLQLKGAEASLPLLDAMAARDAFEERPLIWKAESLRRLKRYPEAEVTARAAIAIDPSDGEQPHGDRMRVYAILANIREGRGDAKEAHFLREVVTAIRSAEIGDDFREAGLVKRSIQLYSKALNHFDNAYCIQSRLAVQLSEQGRIAEAEVHYRRAYELMPESFGRMESHCFGCEGAFTEGRPQQIAEKVFNRLLEENPKKAQLHYLRGYLRFAQHRYGEALPDFRTATQLDPDYINAYLKIQEIAEYTPVPAADQEAAALNLLRIDPFQHHLSADSLHVVNLAKLYEIVSQFPKSQVSSAPLLPMRASAAFLARWEKATGTSLYGERYRSRGEYDVLTPSAAISHQPVVNAVADDLSQLRMSDFYIN